MKAWEIERKKMNEAIPKILSEEEQTWDFADVLEKQSDQMVSLYWASNVPGSYAPESIMIAAVQALENKGFVVRNSERLIKQGQTALENKDFLLLHETTGRLWREIHKAVPNYDHKYYSYTHYHSFEDVLKTVTFPKSEDSIEPQALEDKIYAGWLGQIIGGAVGTAIEGYPTSTIQKTFGEIRGYVRPPNTYNDDITFEIAFLRAYELKNKEITSDDIADQWLRLIPLAWSAEDFALKNLQRGLYPPASATFQNPFTDWIGAQMRGAVCGMVAPGNPKEAARLAWIDAVISHDNNGALGEMFNAILVSLSFVENDSRTLLEKTIQLLPGDSEYYDYVQIAYEICQRHTNWLNAWTEIEPLFKTYNWIHAYPNAMAEVLALWFGEGDFTETLHIISMAGQDVDCNAAQILSALAIMNGSKSIPNDLKGPIADRLDTYLRGNKVLSIKKLAKDTLQTIHV